MSELDNGADIGTPLTIYPSDLWALFIMPDEQYIKVTKSVIRWILTGKREEIDDDILNHFSQSLMTKHSEQVCKHRDNKEKKQGNANARWSKKKMQPQCERNATAMQPHSECNADAMPILIPNTITNNNIKSECDTRAREETYPTEGEVLEVARANRIDEGFASGWFRTMQASGWRDTKGKQIPTRGWRAKFAYAWKDEQEDRKGARSRNRLEATNIHHDETVKVENAF